MSRWLFGDPVETGGYRRGARSKLYRFKIGAQYEIGAPGSGWIVTIPSDFLFDLPLPWWLCWAPGVLPRLHLKMLRAAGLRDLGDLAWRLWFGDALFVDALRADGVKDPIPRLCWLAARTNQNRD